MQSHKVFAAGYVELSGTIYLTRLTRLTAAILYIPYAPCMEYSPTFALKIIQLQVNIPDMEHMGLIT